MTKSKEYTMKVQDTVDRKWHVSKTINVGHLLTTVSLIGVALVFLNSFDDRMNLLEYRADVTDQALTKEHEYVKEVFNRISNDLLYIRNRLDAEQRGD